MEYSLRNLDQVFISQDTKLNGIQSEKPGSRLHFPRHQAEWNTVEETWIRSSCPFFQFFVTYFVSCNGPCAPKKKWHRKEPIIIIIIIIIIVMIIDTKPHLTLWQEDRASIRPVIKQVTHPVIKRVIFLCLLSTAVAGCSRFQLAGVGHDGKVFGHLCCCVTQRSVQL